MGFSTLPSTIAVAGTYERTLCGWELEGGSEDGLKKTSVTPIFAHLAHNGPIKCVASGGRFLVSGGSDEEIRIFNLKKRVEVGSLMRHNGPITCLRFHRTSHLVSGSDDGKLLVWRTRDWQCLAALEGHKAGVIHCDVHPTGRIMISCARDKTVKLWDLVKADCVFSFANPLPSVSEQLHWSPSGKNFSLSSQANISLFDAESSKLLLAMKHVKPVLCSAFLGETDLITGSEDGIVRLWDSRSGMCTRELEPHTQRVRAVCVDGSGRLLSASSDGEVRIYDRGGLEEGPVFKEMLRARVTCACMASVEEEATGGGGAGAVGGGGKAKNSGKKFKKGQGRKWEGGGGKGGEEREWGDVSGDKHSDAGPRGMPKLAQKGSAVKLGTPKSVQKGSGGGGTPKPVLKSGGGGTPKSLLKGHGEGGTPKSDFALKGVTSPSFKKKKAL